MKLKVLVAATAAVVLSANVAAQATSGSSLNESGGGAYLGALAVGVVANPILRDALQAAQLDAACVGNDSKTCMPSISSVELNSVMQSGFGEEWGHFNIDAFGPIGTGAFASSAVCGTIATDESTRVASRHVGMGCNDANSEALFNNIINIALGAGAQSNTATCMGTAQGLAVGAIGFASADTQDASYRFVKLDGESPDLANFIAGNYAMFADVHGGSLTGATTAQPFGTTGAVAAASNPPMHASAGNFSVSNECATGRVRNPLGATGDLTN